MLILAMLKRSSKKLEIWKTGLWRAATSPIVAGIAVSLDWTWGCVDRRVQNLEKVWDKMVCQTGT